MRRKSKFFCMLFQLVLFIGIISINQTAQWQRAGHELQENQPTLSASKPPATQKDNRKLWGDPSLLPFSQDFSTMPLGSQDGASFHPTAPLGSEPRSGPVFSSDPSMPLTHPMMMMNPLTMGAFGANPLFNPFHPAHYAANEIQRHANSLNRVNDLEEQNFSNSLSRSAFPELRVRHQCESIQRQALQVANNLIKRQNKIMFKEIMNYLLKSKFLIGLTEIKLSKMLKTKFLGVIKKYTGLTEDNVRLIHSSDDELLDDDWGMADEDVQDTDQSIFTEPVAPTPEPEPTVPDSDNKKKEDSSWWDDWFRKSKIRKL